MKVYHVEHPTIEELLGQNSNIFHIPDYQRRFAWEKYNLNDLWNDIKILKPEDMHFLGSIVVIARPHSTTKSNPLEIVDGQQRLTAVSLLLCALRDYFKENGKENIALQINSKYLHIVDLEGKIVGTKLELGNLDSKDYSNLIKSNLDDIENGRLKNAYSFFKEKIEELEDLNKIKEFYRKLLKNIICVVISVDQDSDAYRLFETLNIRGLPLSPIDLIKNHLFRVCFRREDVDLEIIKDYWGQIITNLDKENVNAIRFFRQYIMSAKHPEIKEKISESKLYDKFKRVIDKDVTNVMKYVRDIKNQSSLYAKICLAEIDLFDERHNQELNLHLRYLSDIGAVTSYTLLLRSFREVDYWRDILRLHPEIDKLG